MTLQRDNVVATFLLFLQHHRNISKQDFTNLRKDQNLKTKKLKNRQCFKVAHGIIKHPTILGSSDQSTHQHTMQKNLVCFKTFGWDETQPNPTPGHGSNIKNRRSNWKKWGILQPNSCKPAMAVEVFVPIIGSFRLKQSFVFFLFFFGLVF